MKKIYLSLFSLAMVTGASAQRGVTLESKYFGNPGTPSTERAEKTSPEKALVLWSNTMSNASDWVFTNTSAPSSYDWVFTTNQDDIPNAAAALKPFASTTASDGFALINSDGQPGNADGDGAIVANFTNATPIDLTGYPNLILEYEHSYRWWHEDRGVRVSGDGGTTWTEYYVTSDQGGVVANGYPNLQNSDNPTKERINISAVAGNSNNVLVQFFYNDNDYWGWYWVVDDVVIYEQAANDVQNVASWISGENNEGIEYGRTPSNHLDANIVFGSQVFNFGSTAQNNISLTGAFTGPTTLSYSATGGSLAPDSSTILEGTSAQSFGVGLYTGAFTIVSDEETGGDQFDNNIFERNFEITSNVYSIDGIGNQPASTETYTTIGTGSFNGASDGLIVASMYSLKANDQVSGFRVMLAASTVPGGELNGQLLDTAGLWAGDGASPNLIVFPGTQTPAYTINQGHVDQGYIDVLFDAVVTVPAGGHYAAVELWSNANANDITLIDDNSVAQPSRAGSIYIAGDRTYTNGNAPGIRMLMGDWLSVSENQLEGVKTYPNPSTGIVNITNTENTLNTIVVRDIAGRIVMSKTTSTSTTIDLSAQGAGVYTVAISNANGSMVEKVIIK